VTKFDQIRPSSQLGGAKLTFDERVVPHRVDPHAQSESTPRAGGIAGPESDAPSEKLPQFQGEPDLETLIIYQLSSSKFTTQKDLYQSY